MKTSPFQTLLPEREYPSVPRGAIPWWTYWQPFAAQWLELGRSPATLKSVREHLRTIIRFTSLHTLEQLACPNEVMAALLGLKQAKHHNANTYNTYRGKLNTYTKWLHRRGYLTENPIHKVEKATHRHTEQPIMTQGELQQLELCMEHKTYSYTLEYLRDMLFFLLLKHTGARQAELLQLDMDSIYHEQGEWKVKISGAKQKGRDRYYHLSGKIVRLYQRYRQQRNEMGWFHQALFVSMRSQKRWTASGVSCWYRRVTKDTGIDFSGHRVRRFVATYLNANGASITNIQRHLGHTWLYASRLSLLDTATETAL